MQGHGIGHLRYEFAGSCDHASTASAPSRRIRRIRRPARPGSRLATCNQTASKAAAASDPPERPDGTRDYAADRGERQRIDGIGTATQSVSTCFFCSPPDSDPAGRSTSARTISSSSADGCLPNPADLAGRVAAAAQGSGVEMRWRGTRRA